MDFREKHSRLQQTIEGDIPKFAPKTHNRGAGVEIYKHFMSRSFRDMRFVNWKLGDALCYCDIPSPRTLSRHSSG